MKNKNIFVEFNSLNILIQIAMISMDYRGFGLYPLVLKKNPPLGRAKIIDRCNAYTSVITPFTAATTSSVIVILCTPVAWSAT